MPDPVTIGISIGSVLGGILAGLKMASGRRSNGDKSAHDTQTCQSLDRSLSELMESQRQITTTLHQASLVMTETKDAMVKIKEGMILLLDRTGGNRGGLGLGPN